MAKLLNASFRSCWLLNVSIRVILCVLFVIGFSIYAWRNWFVSLCAALCLMAFVEHPDMPKSIGGIHGLNPWNFLMANVLLAWLRHRHREGLVWDMPPYLRLLAVSYLLVIVIAFLRLLFDFQGFTASDEYGDHSVFWVVSEFLINSIKWVLPGILLFDGCRTRGRMIIALSCTLLIYFLLALQVIKHMPLNSVASSGADLSIRANKVLVRSIGYHRVNLSMMLSGASWAMLTAVVLARSRRWQIGLIAAAATISLGQALTGGRAGYVTWGLVGLILCVVRWRKFLPVIPITVIAVCILLPGVKDRMLMGFGSSKGPFVQHTEASEITSGRTIAWPYVIDKIQESPVFGYGRHAMIRAGVYRKIMDDYDGGETFPHPHNAYLELLLDNGVVGFLMVIPFYVVVLWHAFRVLLDRSDPLFAAVGGATCALVLALLIAAMGSQSFYPREGSVGMWAAIGLLFRLSLERKHSLRTGEPLFGEVEEAEVVEVESAPSPYPA